MVLDQRPLPNPYRYLLISRQWYSFIFMSFFQNLVTINFEWFFDWELNKLFQLRSWEWNLRSHFQFQVPSFWLLVFACIFMHPFIHFNNHKCYIFSPSFIFCSKMSKNGVLRSNCKWYNGDICLAIPGKLPVVTLVQVICYEKDSDFAGVQSE